MSAIQRRLKHVATLNDEALGEDTDADFEMQYADISSVDSSGTIGELTTYRFEDAPSRARRRVRDGDVVVSTVRTYLQAIAQIRTPPENLIVSTGFAVVRPRQDLFDARYCKYALREPEFLAEVQRRSVGVNYPAINATDLANIPIPLHALPRQRAIAAYLDRETARLDALVAAKERLLALLAEKRGAIIIAAVTRGLDPNVLLRDSSIPWLGKIPAHWRVAGFRKYLRSLVDYRGRTPEKTRSGLFLVTARNIRSGYIDYESSEEFVDPADAAEIMRRGLPAIGEILFTTEAPLGQAALVDRADVAIAQRVIKLNYDPNVLLNAYALQWILSTPFQYQLGCLATGSTALGIKGERLHLLRNLVPPVGEQRAIVEHIHRETSKIGILQAATERSIALLKERRAAVIAAAVNGQVDLEAAA
jgi:type I restriction enzyme S subunit